MGLAALAAVTRMRSGCDCILTQAIARRVSGRSFEDVSKAKSLLYW